MKILIADDSLFVRQFIRKFLLELNPGLELTFAASGEEGYQKFLNDHFDVIITDLLMPGMGGEEFIKKVRLADRDIKVIVVSADIQKSVKDEILGLGVSAFLNKPIKRENIQEIYEFIGR
ncbi:MAG TPA: response regulator [Clostridia bacterium]|nr:response regulator [Clostridia bacterium]